MSETTEAVMRDAAVQAM